MHRVLLGVTGGIAAYKACELVRELQKANLEVTVIMTEAAQKFVGALTFEALTKKQVYTDLFSGSDRGIAHIELAREHDIFVVAPASAHSLSKMVSGEAQDLLSTVYLAFDGPIVVAPAMNTYMWNHVTTQENLKKLDSQGVKICKPVHGELACGEVGEGKMNSPQEIAKVVFEELKLNLSLQGKKILITAGPTREYIDPVRFLSSPSSGTMGFSIAREASKRGAKVKLIHGPVLQDRDFQAEFTLIESAQEMYDAVIKHEDFDVFIGVAAVADYTPMNINEDKIKKQESFLSIELKRTKDILSKVALHKKPTQVVVGFSAETENLVERATEKLKSKNLDLIVANEVYKEEKGFSKTQTSVVFIDKNGQEEINNTSKSHVALELWNRIEKIMDPS